MEKFERDVKSIIDGAGSGNLAQALHAIASIVGTMTKDNSNILEENRKKIEQFNTDMAKLITVNNNLRTSITMLEEQIKQYEPMKKLLDGWTSTQEGRDRDGRKDASDSNE